MYDLIVIGGGPGGYEAAAHAGRMGKNVALIEKDRIGGTCLNVGCIPSKTFLRSSKLFHEASEGGVYGVAADSVRFEMPAVVERKNRVVDTLTLGVRGLLKRSGVELISGCGKIVSKGTVEANGNCYRAANILIATGSRPAIPPIPGIELPHVLDSNSVFGLNAVPGEVAILGGGYIGLEFACFFREIGAEVTVYEMLPGIAAGADQEIAAHLFAILARQGIQFRLSARVLKIDSRSIHYLDSTGAPARADASCVLYATGRAPMVEGLGLAGAEVDFSPRGIRTSEQGKTNVAGIWASGDVTGRRMLAHAAVREGIVAVNNMFGRPDRVRYHAIPSVIYTRPEVASVGSTEEELRAGQIAYRKAVVPMAVSGRFLVEDDRGAGFLKVLAGSRYGELLGVHAIGNSSSEFIVAAAAMVGMEMPVSRAAEIVFPHPTVSEALREALLQIQ